MDGTKKRPFERVGAAAASFAAGAGHMQEQTANSAWRAFKRLRVDDGSGYSNDEDVVMSNTTPPKTRAPSPQRQASGQKSRETEHGDTYWSSRASTPLRSGSGRDETDTRDTDYKSVNHVLGDLHRQRRLREEQSAAVDTLRVRDAFAAPSPTPFPPRYDTKRHPEAPIAHTERRRRRQVIHLHTDSKLG